MEKQILIIGGDRGFGDFLLKTLSGAGIPVSNIDLCTTLQDALKVQPIDVWAIVLPFPLDGISNLLLLKIVQSHFSNTPIIGIYQDVEIHDELKAIDRQFSLLPFTGLVGKTIIAEINRLETQVNSFYQVELKHANYKRHFYKGNVPMMVYDTESLQILEVNKATVDKYGFTKEELMTMNLLDLMPKEDIESFVDTHENRVYDQFDSGYWRHIKKAGEIFFVNIYTHFADDGEKETGLIFAFDVNDKLLEDLNNKNSQNLIKGQKEQFDSILSTLSDAIWSIRADKMELIYANHAFYSLFGFSPEEMTENIDPFFSLIHHEDQKIFRQAMQGVSYSGSAKVEYRYNHRDGTLKTLQAHVTLIKGSEGKPDTLNGVTVDVTNERALQDKIRKSEQNLLATINNTKDLIWSVNTNLEIIFCNKPYQEYVYQLSRVIPRPGDYVLGEWGSESFINTRMKDYKRALAGESFITVMEENFEGGNLYKEFSNNPIIDHIGNIIGVNCIARDITEQRRQFVKIQEQNEKLIEIAWIQSHKVRSPVATILGLSDLFDYEAGGNEHNSEILGMLRDATHQLDDIIREVVEKTEDLGQG